MTFFENDNSGLQRVEGSHCNPELLGFSNGDSSNKHHILEGRIEERGHNRNKSWTGRRVLKGGVQWLSNKRFENLSTIIVNLSEQINSALREVMPGISRFDEPLQWLVDILPEQKNSQLDELHQLLTYALEVSDTELIKECFRCLNPLYGDSKPESNPMPCSEVLRKHLRTLPCNNNHPVIAWLRAACVINNKGYQKACWEFIRKNNLTNLIYENHNIYILSHMYDQNGIKQATQYKPFQKEILASFSPVFKEELENLQQDDQINLEGNPALIDDLFTFLLTDKIAINFSNFLHFLELADYYSIQSLKDRCVQYIEKNLITFLKLQYKKNYIGIFNNFQLTDIVNLMTIRLIVINSKLKKGTVKNQEYFSNIMPLLDEHGSGVFFFNAKELIDKQVLDKTELCPIFFNNLSKYCKLLCSIDIENNQFLSDESLKIILSDFSCLNYLNLSGCIGITENGFTEAMKSNKAKLQYLSLSHNNLYKGDSLTHSIYQFSNLKVLDLSNNTKIKDQVIRNILINISKIQVLKLKNCRNITDETIQKIAKYCTSTQILNLEGCVRVSDKSIIPISKNLPALEVLNINNCPKVTDRSIFSVAKFLVELTELKMSSCNITDSSVSSICLKIKKIRVLDISKTKITGSSILGIAKKLQHLEYFNISDCDEVRDEHIKVFSSNLSAIKGIHIGNCKKITDVGIKWLITNCPQIQELNLYAIQNISIETIKEIPKYLLAIQHLNVYKCKKNIYMEALKLQRKITRLRIHYESENIPTGYIHDLLHIDLH